MCATTPGCAIILKTVGLKFGCALESPVGPLRVQIAGLLAQRTCLLQEVWAGFLGEVDAAGPGTLL